jgi:hypothetical protein
MQGVSLNTTRVDFNMSFKIQGVIESCADIPTTSHRPHVELRKNTQKSMSKNKMTFIP